MSEDRNWRSEFKKGYDDSEAGGWRNFLGRGVLVLGVPVALFLPVAWYWKIAIYLGGSWAVSMIVQAFAIAKERRQK